MLNRSRKIMSAFGLMLCGLLLTGAGASSGFEWVLEPYFDRIEASREGRAAVFSVLHGHMDGQWGVIDLEGNLVAPLEFDFIEPFVDGLAFVRIGDRVGFIDRSGNAAVPIVFDFALSFNEGRAAVSLDGLWGFVDT